MACTPTEYVGFIGAMAFFGAFISCFFLPALGDVYGRYTLWVVTIFCQLPIYLGAGITSHIGVIYVMCFVLGMGLIGRFACGFVMLTEQLPDRVQASAGTALMVGDVVATLYITFFIRYISNNAITLIWIGFALNIVGCILALWIVESPAWLLSVGRKDLALQRLRYIAKINGIHDFVLEGLKQEKFVTLEKGEDAKKEEAPTFGSGGQVAEQLESDVAEEKSLEKDAHDKLVDGKESVD